MMPLAASEFLLASLRASPLRKDPARLGPERLGGVDWEALLRQARLHRVLAFLGPAWSRSGVLSAVPEGVRRALARETRRAAWENLVKRRQYAVISGILRESGFPVIPLKGIALTHLLYRDSPVRLMGDIDLLVRERDLPGVRDLLVERGFALPVSVNPGQDPASRGRGSVLRGDLDVDLQWRPAFFVGGRYVEFPADRAWREARPCPALGSNARMLDPVDQALYLALQIADDLERQYVFLAQVLDLALLQARCGVSAGRVLDRAAAEGGPRECLRGLLRAVEEVFQEGCPLGALSEGSRAIWLALLRGPHNPDPVVGLRALRQARSLRARIAFLAGYFVPDADYLRQMGGRGGLPLGYILHWVRLARKLPGAFGLANPSPKRLFKRPS